MSGITGAMNTALSGLELFQAGISTVSNNLANQSTSGYTVESVNGATQIGAVGQPGTGVEVPQITRAASFFAASLLRSANTAAAAASAQSTSLTTLSGAMTNNGDVQAAMNQFYQDVATLAANPTSTAQRQTVLADAQTVTSNFQNAAGVINDVISGASENLAQGVSAANQTLAQLAVINKDLRLAPNDPGLLDQQQGALNTLSGLLPVHALPQANGSVVLTSGGTVLLDQSGPQTLQTVQATPSSVPQIIAGSAATPISLGAADGSIGSAVAGIQAGQAAFQGLSAVAAIFAGNVNNVQAQGLTPSGASGAALFSVPAPSVIASAANTGSASLVGTLSNPAQLPVDGGPFTLTYQTATGWSAVDQASGQVYPAPGTPPAFAGLTFAIFGTPANGDQFTVNPAPDAATGITVTTNNSSAIAAADPYVASPGVLQTSGAILDQNGGSIAGGTDIVTTAPNAGSAIIPAAYFGQNLQVNFTSATAYNISTSAAPGTAIASGVLTGGNGSLAIAYPAGPANGQYWQLPISGSPVAGDSLTLTPGGSTSGSNATRMAASWTASGTSVVGTLQQAVIGFGTNLGAAAQAAQNQQSATAAQVTSATGTLQAVAGVNTDQQAVILTNYQQAYQAAAQAISVAHTMFESLLTAV
ncbi:MAG: flagellar basal body protein [Acidocella sp.]|nr:flagellar basal body protein [Acidocella sp.]